MITVTYILMAIALLSMAFIIVAFIYTIVITYRQSKTFINNLKVGDETNFGEISEIEGEYVIINREPLRIHMSEIQPKEFAANKLLFMSVKQ